MSNWVLRTRVALLIELLLLGPILPLLPGCGSAAQDNSNTNRNQNSNDNSGGGGEFEPSTLSINNIPDDPTWGEINKIESGERLIFYGQKDEDGFPTTLEMLQYFTDGAEEPQTVVYEDGALPVYVSNPDGSVANLSYDGDMVICNIIDTEGTLYIEAVNLPEGTVDDARQQALAARQMSAEFRAQRQSQQSAMTHITYFGHVDISMVEGETPEEYQAIGAVPDAKLHIKASNITTPIVWQPDGAGGYDFTVSHYAENLQVTIDECQLWYGVSGAAFTVGGIVIAALAIGCSIGSIVSLAICGFASGLAGALESAALGAGGLAGFWESLDCRETVIQAAVQAGSGKQRLDITASHIGHGFSDNQIITYDVYDPDDPYYNSKRINLTFSVPVTNSITSVSTIPAAPEPGESYQLSATVVSIPGTTLEYTVIPDAGGSAQDTIAITAEGKSTVTGNYAIIVREDAEYHNIVANLLHDATELDSKHITVNFRLQANEPPVVQILAPLVGATYQQGDSVEGLCTGEDPEDGVLGGSSIAWSTGATGGSPPLLFNTVGELTLTCTATDSQGLQGSDSVSITVEPQQNDNVNDNGEDPETIDIEACDAFDTLTITPGPTEILDEETGSCRQRVTVSYTGSAALVWVLSRETYVNYDGEPRVWWLAKGVGEMADRDSVELVQEKICGASGRCSTRTNDLVGAFYKDGRPGNCSLLHQDVETDVSEIGLQYQTLSNPCD